MPAADFRSFILTAIVHVVGRRSSQVALPPPPRPAFQIIGGQFSRWPARRWRCHRKPPLFSRQKSTIPLFSPTSDKCSFSFRRSCMVPIKIECECGQNYAFDVEPLNGRMPTRVACPTCGADGTTTANDTIARHLGPPPAPII